VGFDIIPNHKAGFADAIVCHVWSVQRENGMRRECVIVAESGLRIDTGGGVGCHAAPWHTSPDSGAPRRTAADLT